MTSLSGGLLAAPGRLFSEMKHSATQQPIGLGLVTAAIRLEPCENVGIQAHRYRLFERTVELANFGAPPIQDLGGIRKVNIFVSLCGDGPDLFFLFLCELLDKPAFRVIPPRGPK
jgi:hypothetical protein